MFRPPPKGSGFPQPHVFMDTRPFKTRTILQNKKNPIKNPDIWPIALDMGYSSVKGFNPNSIFCFPSYARKLPRDNISLGKPEPTDILYRDTNNGDVYAVGNKAESLISIESTNDSNATLYGRNRYFSPIFKICSQVGLAMSMIKNEYGDRQGKRLVMQTGLPPKYMTDAPLLKEAFANDYDFEVKIGRGDWMHFTFSLLADDIHITQQPMGTMVSVAIDRNGNPTSDAERLYKSNMLVFDPGFRTGDCCLIKRGDINPDDCQTIDDLSMISVLQKTSDEIAQKFGVNVSVPAIQPYLETGYIKYFDKKNLKSSRYDFGSILEAKNKEVADLAIKTLCDIYNYFEEIDYLAITGGTGAAWSDLFKDRLKDLQTLTIIPGNRNEDLPRIFSNVRGYYMYLINTVAA